MSNQTEKEEIRKICPTCGKQFDTLYNQKKYCSEDCYKRGVLFFKNNPIEHQKYLEKLRLRYINKNPNDPIYQNKLSKNKEKYRVMKMTAQKKLGGRCVYCRCNVYEALEFNHINGGGSKESKTIRHVGLRFFKDIISEKRNDIELSCRVCNSVHYLQKLKGLGDHWKVIFVP